MLSPFFLPLEHFGVKFDRTMQLMEFSAFREPEKTRFPLIGEFVRQHIDVVRIPHPEVLFQEPLPYDGISYAPDFFISNHTKAFAYSNGFPKTTLHPYFKSTYSNEIDYEITSILNNGTAMHEWNAKFCRKVCGLPTKKILAKYHRALWLPMYWPETLGQNWDTPFYYPKEGYAGALAERIGVIRTASGNSGIHVQSVGIDIAYCLATVSRPFSVLFVPELRRTDRSQSPIYRITDQDVCAGTDSEVHRLVVEYRGECDVASDLAVLGITVQDIAYGKGRIVPPTRENVEAGYNFSNNLNSQIWELMQ